MQGEIRFFECAEDDGFAKSQKPPSFVIPAKAGIQSFQALLDSRSPTTTFGDRLRGSDGLRTFYEFIKEGKAPEAEATLSPAIGGEDRAQTLFDPLGLTHHMIACPVVVLDDLRHRDLGFIIGDGDYP
jgi:hypothetical protein